MWPRNPAHQREIEMTRAEALEAIQTAMDVPEWSPDTLDTIAAILQAAGYPLAVLGADAETPDYLRPLLEDRE
jgi:hypothetical protein